MSLTWNTSTGSVNTEVTGTFTFKNNDVRGLYIDWDDGDSNKKEDANYQWVQFTEPKSTTDVKHTYNKTGTFYPVVQTFNSRGFVSRFYSANTSEADVTPWSQDTNVASLPVTDFTATSVLRTQNKTLKSGIDNSIFDLFGPQRLYVSIFPTLTNTEIEYALPIEIDLTLLVDNTLLSGNSTSTTALASDGGGGRSIETVTCVLSGTKVTAAANNRLLDVLADGTHDRNPLLSGATVARVLEVKYKNPKYVGASGNADYTANEVYNRLKVGFFIAGGTSYWYNNLTGFPVCYITPGDPIKKASDVERQLILDFSQSRAAAANVGMSTYFFDNGKTFFTPGFPWTTFAGGDTTSDGEVSAIVTTIPVVSTANFPASGTFYIENEIVHYTNITATSFLDCTRGYSDSTAAIHADGSAVKVGMYFNSAQQRQYWQFKGGGSDKAYQINQQRSISYSYSVDPYGMSYQAKAMPWKTGTLYDSPWTTTNAAANTYTSGNIAMDQFLLDDFGRLAPQEHLVRLQVEPSSSTSYKSLLNVPAVFRITPAKSWSKGSGGGDASAANARLFPTTLLDSGTNNSYSEDFSTQNMRNVSGSEVNLSGANYGDQWDMADVERPTDLEEYILLLFDKKPNKLFFNMSNYASGIQSATTTAPIWGIGGVSVLMIENSGTNMQSVHWEPLEFEDGTAVSRERRNTTTDTYDTYNYSLVKSGVVSFDPPAGWESIKFENLYGGRFATSAISETSGSYGFGPISGTVSGTATAGTLYGDYFTITGTSADTDITAPLSGATDEDIDSFKFIALPYSGSQYQLQIATAYFDTTPVATNQITNNASYGSSTKIFRVDSVSGTAHFWGEFTTGDAFAEDIDLFLFNASNVRITQASTDPTAYLIPNVASGNAFWITKDGGAGYEEANSKLFFHIGDTGSVFRSGAERLAGDMKFTIQRINGYEAVDGFSRVYLPSGGTANKLPMVDDFYPVAGWDNTFNVGDGSIGTAIKHLWYGQDKYAVKITLSGAAVIESGVHVSPINVYPSIWNIFDASEGYHNVIRVLDDSAFNLNSLAVTSSINVGRAGQYFKAITRKGKIIITKTGIIMQEVGFSSVALGDESSSTAFDDHGPSSLYGHLHTLRRIQAEDCRVYWDEPQKDGTFVRLFGVVQNVNETSGTGGPRRVVQYTFTLVLDGVAVLGSNGKLMTDIFPLGGIEDEKTYA